MSTSSPLTPSIIILAKHVLGLTINYHPMTGPNHETLEMDILGGNNRMPAAGTNPNRISSQRSTKDGKNNIWRSSDGTALPVIEMPTSYGNMRSNSRSVSAGVCSLSVGSNAGMDMLRNNSKRASIVEKKYSENSRENSGSYRHEDQHKISELEEEVEQLKTELAYYKTEESQWSLEKQKVHDRMEDLRADLENMQNSMNQERASMKDTLEKAVEEKQNHLNKNIEETLKNIQLKNQQQIEELEARYQSELATLHSKHNTEVQLQARLYQEQLEKLEYQLSLKSEENNQAEESICHLQQDKHNTDQELERMKLQIDELESRNATAEQEIIKSSSLVNELKAKIESQNIRINAADEVESTLRSKLMKEEVIRRKLHNQIQELKGNIRVFCRVRPPLEKESNENEVKMVFPDQDMEAQQLALAGPTSESAMGSSTTKKYSFSFDRVFSPSSLNKDVFEEISQLIQSALDGYNVCIFAYGQTGSGKTYTMSEPQDGMIARSVKMIFETAESLKEKGWHYTLEGQFVEIYNENLNDLLSQQSHAPLSPGKNDSSARLEIRHDPKTQKTTVVGLTSVELDSLQKVNSVLSKASDNRSTASTRANERSSRSHSVFMLHIKGRNVVSGHECSGTLNLIDLAGSERLSHSQATGDRLKETQAINKSLSCLGDVIHALGSGKDKSGHIPYRNSKLTYLLQYSLSGDSKTLMFVNISPLEAHMNETVSSLRFATKVNDTTIKKK